jgi:hypothetical protein
MNVTRLGVKGELVRCSASRGVLTAEKEQRRCSGTETAIGTIAYNEASEAVRAVFGTSRKRSGLTYEVALKELSEKNDSAAKAIKTAEASSLVRPATTAASSFTFPNRPTGPSKPAGFA